MKTPIEQLQAMVDNQCSNGNWNCDAYMHGYANGLILALATMKGEEPKFLDAPAVWLNDMPGVRGGPTETVGAGTAT